MVQFYPWFQFSFLLFLGMVMYDNSMIMSLKQKKRKFEPRIKLNHNIYIRKLESARVSYRDYFLISYRVYMMSRSFHISLFEGTRDFMLIKYTCH